MIVDFPAVNSAALAALRVLVQQWLPGGTFRGNEYVVTNPTRTDKTAGSFSINVQTGVWKDFSNGDGGKDPVSLFAYINQLSQGESCKRLSDIVGASSAESRGPDRFTELVPVVPNNAPEFPAQAWIQINGRWVGLTITHRWAYHSALGEVLFYVVRYNLPDGSKQVKPYCLFRAPDGAMKWRSKAYPEPRPMYALDRIAHAPGAQLIGAEGEKCAQTLQGLIDGAGMGSSLIVTTWQGGANAPKKTDWTPARGRQAILWPDNDADGTGAMHKVAGILKGLGCQVKVVTNPADRPPGWDCADAILIDGWDLDRIFAWIKSNGSESTAEPVAVAPAKPLPPAPEVHKAPPEPALTNDLIVQRTLDALGRDNILSCQSGIHVYEPARGVWLIIPVADFQARVQRELKKIVSASKYSATLVRSVSELARREVELGDLQFDRDLGDTVVVRNGIVSLQSAGFVLKPFDRQAFRTLAIDVLYDPEADSLKFLRYLEETFADDEDMRDKIECVLEMIGYSLMTHCRYERFLLLVGCGSNGKSVLLLILQLLVGIENCAAVSPFLFDNQFHRAFLFRKLVNIITELEAGHVIADAALKAITSGELMNVSRKHESPFDMTPFSTCWFGTNHMPHTRDFSDALFRRAIILRFNKIFLPGVNQNTALKTKEYWLPELPGIFNLALQAYRRAAQRGGIIDPKSSLEAKHEWRIEADQCAQFVGECVVVQPGSTVPSGELYAAFTTWASKVGVRHVVSHRELVNRLEMLGFKHCRTNDERFVSGLRLKGYGFGE